MAKTTGEGGGLSGGGAGKYAPGGMRRVVRKAAAAGRASVENYPYGKIVPAPHPVRRPIASKRPSY